VHANFCSFGVGGLSRDDGGGADMGEKRWLGSLCSRTVGMFVMSYVCLWLLM
jgi:hypothetical protein